jgi:hypothetical protein
VRLALAVAIATTLLARDAAAVGTEGPEEARTRFGAAIGGGFDAVDGFGADRFAFVEASAQAEARLRRWLDVGGAATLRQDVRDYDFALGATRARRTRAVAVQAFFGYDGPAFHLSVGPWLYGDGRYDDRFRADFAGWGVLRLRVGHLDRWHGTLSVLDGAPWTAAGAATSVRLLVGPPPLRDGRHRLQVGPSFTIGEAVAGLFASDEIALAPGALARALRVGGNLGAGHANLTRWEAMAFAGFVW